MEKDSNRAITRTRPILEKILSSGLVEEQFLRPLPDRPAAYLVFRPPERTYSIVSMVWGAKQKFPIHDHLSWGLIGVYSNAIREERFTKVDDGSREDYAEIEETGMTEFREGEILEEGLVFDERHRNDIHRILNPNDKPSVTIHILASDLGMKQRNQYDPAARTVKKFVSGYDDPDGNLEGRVVAGNDTTQIIGLKSDVITDTRGLVCPAPTRQTLAKLAQMGTGGILEVLTDSEDSAYDEIPKKLKSEGLEFVVLEQQDGSWKIKVRA